MTGILRGCTMEQNTTTPQSRNSITGGCEQCLDWARQHSPICWGIRVIWIVLRGLHLSSDSAQDIFHVISGSSNTCYGNPRIRYSMTGTILDPMQRDCNRFSVAMAASFVKKGLSAGSAGTWKCKNSKRLYPATIPVFMP